LGLALLPNIGIHRGEGGTGVAGIPGDIPAGPLHMLVPALLLALPLVRRVREGWARLFLGSVVGLLLTSTLVLVGAGHGWDLDQYYVVKSLWFLTLFLGPVLALGTTRLALLAARPMWQWAGRNGSTALVSRFAMTAAVSAAAFALWLPWLLGGNGSASADTVLGVGGANEAGRGGGSANLSQQRFDLARTYGVSRDGAIVVAYFVGSDPLFDTYGTRVVSELITFQTGQAEVSSEDTDVCTAIHTLAEGQPTIVLSKLTVRRVEQDMARHGCAGAARITHVPGGFQVPPVQPDPAPAAAVTER
jgi:hypothetical protein